MYPSTPVAPLGTVAVADVQLAVTWFAAGDETARLLTLDGVLLPLALKCAVICACVSAVGYSATSSTLPLQPSPHPQGAAPAKNHEPPEPGVYGCAPRETASR